MGVSGYEGGAERAGAEPGDGRRIRVLAICGSLRESSYTYRALREAMRGAEEAGGEVSLLDAEEQAALPYCDGREDPSTYPPVVHRLRERVRTADALLLATPEYHNSCSGVLKNVLDLLSDAELKDKMVGLISVAGGASGMSALANLRLILRAVHAWVALHQVMVPHAWKAFDEAGRIADPKLTARLREVGGDVVAYAARLRR